MGWLVTHSIHVHSRPYQTQTQRACHAFGTRKPQMCVARAPARPAHLLDESRMVERTRTVMG